MRARAALVAPKAATRSPRGPSEGPLAAVLGKACRIVETGFLPFSGRLSIARGRAVGDMELEPGREGDVGFEGDAGDRPVRRRGDLEPRQFGLVLHQASLLGLAISGGSPSG